jgi:hypothetical protein
MTARPWPGRPKPEYKAGRRVRPRTGPRRPPMLRGRPPVRRPGLVDGRGQRDGRRVRGGRPAVRCIGPVGNRIPTTNSDGGTPVARTTPSAEGPSFPAPAAHVRHLGERPRSGPWPSARPSRPSWPGRAGRPQPGLRHLPQRRPEQHVGPGRVQPPGLRHLPPATPPDQARRTSSGRPWTPTTGRHHPQRHRPDGRLRHPGHRPQPPQRAHREVVQGVVPPGPRQGAVRAVPQPPLPHRQRRRPRQTAKLPVRRGADAAGPGRPTSRSSPPPSPEKREVPWRYTFLNPLPSRSWPTSWPPSSARTTSSSPSRFPRPSPRKSRRPRDARPRRQLVARLPGRRRRRAILRRATSSRSTRTRTRPSTTSGTTGRCGPSRWSRPSCRTSSCSRR